MIRYILFVAMVALGAASLAACSMNWAYRDPSPGDRRHAGASEGAASSNASYSSQLSVMNRRGCHEKQEKNCG